MKHKLLPIIQKHFLSAILLLLALLFSIWLMFSTFSYSNDSMMIAGKAWSDFANHIPLIRSFSLGDNFPPEFPLFPGEAIRYHFLFYFLVGMLERVGLRIDYALNIPSVLGFFVLLVLIYKFSYLLFKSRAVSILSVLFFLFNGSLGFLYFLETHPLSLDFLKQIVTNDTFPAFGPYDGRIVSAFWNLNIYTNQRHFAPALAISLFIITLVFQAIIRHKKISLLTLVCSGTSLGFLFFFNTAVFLMTGIVLGAFLLLFSKTRISILIILFIGALLALPQYAYMQTAHSEFQMKITPGYLIYSSLSPLEFFKYWFYNFGLHLILIPLGIILAGKMQRKVFASFFLLFIIGNLIQFSVEIAANHKFFNFFLMISAMFSAYAVVGLWKKHMFFKPVAVSLICFLIFSGIIDFFPVYRDGTLTLEDYPKNQDALWIKSNTPPDAVLFNTSFLYHPASLAGRKIYLGWPYFAWSHGSDTTGRFHTMQNVLAQNNSELLCRFLRTNHLEYLSLESKNQDFPYDENYWENNFTPVYESTLNNFKIYKTKDLCQDTLSQ